MKTLGLALLLLSALLPACARRTMDTHRLDVFSCKAWRAPLPPIVFCRAVPKPPDQPSPKHEGVNQTNERKVS